MPEHSLEFSHGGQIFTAILKASLHQTDAICGVCGGTNEVTIEEVEEVIQITGDDGVYYTLAELGLDFHYLEQEAIRQWKIKPLCSECFKKDMQAEEEFYRFGI